jgi:tRNA(Ile)-lysidine synthase
VNLDRHIAQFAAAHGGRGLLIGLSGGPDSLALFHMLRRSKVQRLHVAHVDHQWRKTSGEEARLVQGWAGDCPFHLKTLEPGSLSGNLEDACRRERLIFFKELCIAHQLEGVVLAHHRDDQAETVLKRVLEGASLTRLAALQEVSAYEGLTLFRPLISVRKRELEEWLYRHRISPLLDPTNEDPRFLRARMRTSLFPAIEQHFGKEVADPLAALGAEAAALRRHLDARTAEAWKGIATDEESMKLCIKGFELDVFELEYLIRRVGDKLQLTLPRQIVALIASLLLSGDSRWEGEFGRWRILVNSTRCMWRKTGSSAIIN